MRRLILLAACLALSAGPALAQATTAKSTDGKDYLQAPSGMTLYVFDGDKQAGGTPGPSICYDECAESWPPFVAASADVPHGDWAIAPRKDGARQWTFKGRPLYTFVRDKKAGDQLGNAFNGNKWHLVAP